MWKQKNGGPHNTWRGYKHPKRSGRCSKCTTLLARVRQLPIELRHKIGRHYFRGLVRRARQPKNQMRLKKKVSTFKRKYFKKR